MATHSPALIEYLKTKRNWSTTTFNDIHWDALELCQRGKKNRNCIKSTQMMHNWQNVGSQKCQFGETRDTEYKCPFGCRQEETQMHYLQCPVLIGSKQHREQITTLQKSMKKLNTIASIYSTITFITLNIRDTSIFTSNEDSTLAAFDSQTTIGWIAFFQGYISIQWEKVQFEHSDEESPITVKHSWTSKLIGALQEYTNNMWELRNNKIHGATSQETREITLAKLRERATLLYEHSDRQYIPFNASFNAFKRPKEHILRKRLQGLEVWIDVAEECLRLHREEALKINKPRCKYKKSIAEYMAKPSNTS